MRHADGGRVRSFAQSHSRGVDAVCAVALALCALAAQAVRAEPEMAHLASAMPKDPDGAPDALRDDTVVATDGAPAAAPHTDPSPVALAEPPAALAPLPGADVRFGRVDPLELLVSAATGSAGCAAIAVPFGACGALTAVYGVGAIVGVLGLGLPVFFAVSGAFAAYCISVPLFFALGPMSSSTAFVGAVQGLALSEKKVPVVPMLIAALPSIGIALFGSTLAFIGTTMLTGAVIGVDPEGIQASTVLIAAGLLTAALSGPVAVLATVTAGQLFAPVDEERSSEGPAERARPASSSETRAASARF
jgi:hypothetical protein